MSTSGFYDPGDERAGSQKQPDTTGALDKLAVPVRDQISTGLAQTRNRNPQGRQVPEVQRSRGPGYYGQCPDMPPPPSDIALGAQCTNWQPTGLAHRRVLFGQRSVC